VPRCIRTCCFREVGLQEGRKETSGEAAPKGRNPHRMQRLTVAREKRWRLVTVDCSSEKRPENREHRQDRTDERPNSQTKRTTSALQKGKQNSGPSSAVRAKAKTGESRPCRKESAYRTRRPSTGEKVFTSASAWKPVPKKDER